MSTIKNGGPAFPFISHGAVANHQFVEAGMTLRDYFAAKAMQGMFAYGAQAFREDGFPLKEAIATQAYRMSDAMLKAREGGAA